MKKAFYFLGIILLFLLLFGCTVSSTMGRISIYNETNKAMTNIKLGNTLLALSVNPGASYDYYYYAPMSGKLSVSGLDNPDGDGRDPDGDGTYTGYTELDYTFNLNQWVWILGLIRRNSDTTTNLGEDLDQGDSYLSVSVDEQGSDESLDADEWCEE